MPRRTCAPPQCSKPSSTCARAAHLLQPPVPGYLEQLGPQERAMLDSVLSCTAIGAPKTVKAKMAAFIAETGADELMITSQIFEHQHRLRSYEITAQVHAELAQQQ